MNIVFIVCDTLRRDYLRCYGGQTVRTPNIDRLAERSVVLDRYYAGSFPTVPARQDLLLGKWCFTFLGWDPLPMAERPLPAILTANGYQTVGVVDTPFFTINGFGYDRGFHYFYDLDTQRTGEYPMPVRGQLIPRPRTSEFDYCAPRTMTLAEQCLEHLYEQSFFLYVDTWDPHEPWDPPPWYVRQYIPDYDGRKHVRPPYGNWRNAGLTERDLDIARACYAGEMTMVDRWIGRLIERLDSLGVADRTAVILTTDHGFYFGERDLLGKMIRKDPNTRVWERSPLYEEIAHNPFMISMPGVKPGRLRALLSAVDVMPTVLEIAGVPRPGGIHGRSFLPLVRGEAGSGRDFVVTSMPLANPGQSVRVVDDVTRQVAQFQPATITTSEWSLLYSARGEAVELYHLPTDPRQAANVAKEHTAVVRDLHGRYVGLLEAANTSPEYLEPRRSL